MGDLYNTAKGQLLNQFSESTNLLALLEVLFARLEDSKGVLDYIATNVNLDTAEDVWLDIIGRIVGVEKPPKEQDPATIFTCKSVGEADDPAKGCYSAGPPVTGGYVQTIEGLTDISDPSAMETNDNYRKLIRAKTFANNATGTFADLYVYLKNGFGVHSELSSPEAGNVVITLYSFLSQRERQHVIQYGPRLAGILIEFANWPAYEE
jgi:hypothetical protein